MSVITYRGMKMGVTHLREGIWEPVNTADDSGYIVTKVTLDCDAAILNPSIISFRDSGDGRRAPTNNAGEFAGDTWKAIRHHLMQKRGQLTFAAGGVIILSSPDTVPGQVFDSALVNKYPDAWNGPHPERCEFIRVTGNKSIEISFRITTYIHECGGPGQRQLLLAHRWKRFVDTDQDQYATVVTEGEATFNTYMLQFLGTFPDQYRRNLFHAIPQNHRRVRIQVWPNEDGASVRYRTMDQEIPFNTPQTGQFTPGGAQTPIGCTRIEAFQTGFYAQQGLEQTAGNMVRATARNVGHAMMHGAGSTFGSGVIVGLAGAAILTGVNFAEFQMPRYYMHFTCKAWGHRNSRRRALEQLVLGVIFARLSRLGVTADNYRKFFSAEFLETQELSGKYCECWFTLSWGEEVFSGEFARDPTAAFLDRLELGAVDANPVSFARDAGINTIRNLFTNPDDTRPWLDERPEIANEPPPNSGGTRGTWLGRLMAQALSEPCTNPGRAPDVNVNTTTADLDFPV